MITAVSVYGFAPYGWDQKVERGTVLGSNLALDTMEKIIIPSVWGGPSQQSLVLLGALYGNHSDRCCLCDVVVVMVIRAVYEER